MGCCYVIELHAYDFLIKYFIIKKDVICAGPCILKPEVNILYTCYSHKIIPYLHSYRYEIIHAQSY